jgi:AAA domain-containing protein
MMERVKLEEFNSLPSIAVDAGDGPVFTDLRDVEARDVVWLDRPFMPAGELVTNNADGDTGKGLLAVHYGARVSRGEFGERRMVVFAVAEDAFETVLKPRLLAAEANLEYVRAVNWRRDGFRDALRIPDDIPTLESAIAAMDAQLLIIDPLLSHISAKTNSHVDHEVRVALQPLVELAHSTGCTVLGNGNFSKDKARGARSAASGSTAFTNTPRLALAMAYDDEDPDVRVLEIVKSNIGPKGNGRNYRVKTVSVEGLLEEIPLLVPEGAATKSVDDLLLVQRDKRVPAELVKAIVLRELATGEKSRGYLDAACKDETGANPDSVYKSALVPLKELGRIRARKESMTGGWYWRLVEDG